MIEEKQEFFEEEEISEPSVVFRIFKGLIALTILVGLVYLSGLDRYFFYQKTPPKVEQERVLSAVDAKEIVVPLSLFILKND